MTDTLVAVEPSDEHDDGIVEVPADRSVDELEVARELVRQAREAGVRLTGPDGLLKAMTKTVLETALDEEMSEHLGYDKHDQRGRGQPAALTCAFGTRSRVVIVLASRFHTRRSERGFFGVVDSPTSLPPPHITYEHAFDLREQATTHHRQNRQTNPQAGDALAADSPRLA